MSDQDEGVRIFVHAALAAIRGVSHLTEAASGVCCDCEREAAREARTTSASAGPLYRIGQRSFCVVCATNRARVARQTREAA